MTLTMKLFVFLAYTAMIMVLQCKADQLPAPTGLSYKWLDAFTVNVSWEKPSVQLEDSKIQFMVKDAKNKTTCSIWRNITLRFLTEEIHSDNWTVSVWTVSQCNSSDGRQSATLAIPTQKPRGELVKDFKCAFPSTGRNCSWIPAHQSQKMMLSYRVCGQQDETIKSLNTCDEFHSSGERNYCNLNLQPDEDICILLQTEDEMITFNPKFVAPPLKLDVTEEKGVLKLKWTPPSNETKNCWTYEICYKQCNENVCQNIINGETETKVNYNKRCRYEFQSKMYGVDRCFGSRIESDYVDTISYGTDEPDDWTLTLVAVVIPIILSICVILSCYCFRRHSAIFCPIIPDPSAIFKDIMMNGNKELKITTGNLYTPVPEPIEPCKITLVTEKSALQQHS
uniref:uncharacterized protein LOC124054873 isoform X2 n=1 Tax=Scatophagus argus TaxID=75038 RepID=UPI001ED826CD|nr:uncharacterized protein LOC124054873 isoform X2 [Scatophagus argus]